MSCFWILLIYLLGCQQNQCGCQCNDGCGCQCGNDCEAIPIPVMPVVPPCGCVDDFIQPRSYNGYPGQQSTCGCEEKSE